MSPSLPALCECFGCPSPATVDGLCEIDWWIERAEAADIHRGFRLLLVEAALTERDALTGSSAARPGAIRKDALASRSVSDPDPGDTCSCEKCR